MSVSVRVFSHGDRDGVLELWREVFHSDPAHRVPHLDLERKLALQPELLFVAVDAGTVIGTAMAGYDGHRGWLYYLAVRPAHRRRGIGRRLVEQVEEALADRGCPKINLQIRAGNDRAVAFYAALGYRVEERVSMGKRLPAP